MKRFIFALLLMFAVPAMACDIQANGLTKEALAQLKVACEQAKLEAIKGSATTSTLVPDPATLTPERISAIGQTASEIAKALGTAAAQLGIAVNDFLLSPAGILVVLGIFWKLFLVQTIGIIGMLVVLWTTRWWFLRILVESYTSVEETRWWGYKTVTKRIPTYITVKELSEEQYGFLAVVIIISLILMAILTFGFIM